MASLPYTALDGFSGVYLEDSFVLAIDEAANSLSFVLEAVLTPEHHCYVPPDETQQHCYKAAHLAFLHVRQVKWCRRTFERFYDQSNTFDLGNIDSMSVEGAEYLLCGDWGEVALWCDVPPRLTVEC